MAIWDFMTGLMQPVTDLIDAVHTSDEERLQLKAQIMRIQTEAMSKLQDYEMALLKAKSNIIVAEAKGDSWLQRSWRPLGMVTLLVLVVLDSLGILPNRLSTEAWTMIQVGFGGYVVGRSAEKTAPKLVNAIKGDKS